MENNENIQNNENIEKDWNSKLFDIDDIKEEPCLDLTCAFCCPRFTSSVARTKDDKSSLIFNCLCLSVPAQRNIIRKSNNIKGSWLRDLVCGFFCPCFVSRQMLNEVKHKNNETGQVDLKGPMKQTMEDFKYEINNIKN